MAVTYEPIATTTLGSAQSSVSFTSISGSFTDLILVFQGTLSATANGIAVRFNSDTGSNYSRTSLYGDGSSAASVRESNQTSNTVAYYSGSYLDGIVQVMNYSNSTTNKTTITRQGTGGFVVANVGLWRNTNAITRIDVINLGAGVNFASGFTFTLYGIKAA